MKNILATYFSDLYCIFFAKQIELAGMCPRSIFHEFSNNVCVCSALLHLEAYVRYGYSGLPNKRRNGIVIAYRANPVVMA